MVESTVQSQMQTLPKAFKECPGAPTTSQATATKKNGIEPLPNFD